VQVERKSIAGSSDEYISVEADYRIKRREGFGRRTVLVMVFEGLTEYRINTNPR
jgi:hypothetical protein